MPPLAADMVRSPPSSDTCVFAGTLGLVIEATGASMSILSESLSPASSLASNPFCLAGAAEALPGSGGWPAKVSQRGNGCLLSTPVATASSLPSAFRSLLPAWFPDAAPNLSVDLPVARPDTSRMLGIAEFAVAFLGCAAVCK